MLNFSSDRPVNYQRWQLMEMTDLWQSRLMTIAHVTRQLADIVKRCANGPIVVDFVETLYAVDLGRSPIRVAG
ncbi:hypothetical protein CQ12_37485 [Bradyrhizobium jicamae]|uniref:Uncharacterized protein n=1 Tax=Bradyrhizobium jicamae TaxID=280332 RepID=A0A0R3KNP6_9BRAD|nr:hypothetical protein CQ12_37485 [Bradyrhizobium jicamae]